MELSILMPCLNEAETLAVCIGKARMFLDENYIDGEILISDNGSVDGSVDIVIRHADGFGFVDSNPESRVEFGISS